MTVPRAARCLAAVLAALTIAAPAMSRVPPQDQKLAVKRELLLKSYGDFKGYGVSPDVVYQTKLDADRRMVFDGIVRALFLEIEDKPHHGTGEQLIDFVDGVHGIWGARRNDSKGTHMFRLSVRWKAGLEKALARADNIGDSSSAHVLMEVARGGDDDPNFTGFQVLKSGLKTYRESSLPSVQVTFVVKTPEIGEVDVDLDPKRNVICHNRPSNSDVSSLEGSHSHLDIFNGHYSWFQQPLSGWTSAKHCEPTY